jgi:hypothetical protein
MTSQRQSVDWSAVEEAFEALQPFYDPGDDGDGIRLALDAIAGVLSDATERELEGDESLATLLEELKATKDLIQMVEDLYTTAEGGSYGEGMSKEDANKVNDLVQDIEEPLREFLEKKKRTRRKRAAIPRRKRAKSK